MATARGQGLKQLAPHIQIPTRSVSPNVLEFDLLYSPNPRTPCSSMKSVLISVVFSAAHRFIRPLLDILFDASELLRTTTAIHVGECLSELRM